MTIGAWDDLSIGFGTPEVSSVLLSVMFLLVYAPNGFDGPSLPNNPAAELPPLGYAVNAAGVAMIGDLVVVAGGVRDTGFGPSNLNSILVYNTTTGGSTVSSRSFPSSRRGTMAFAYNSEVFVVGGFDGAVNLNETWAFNPLTDQLRYVGSIPIALSYGAIAFDGTSAYVVGGLVDGGGSSNQILAINPATGQSSLLSITLPAPLWLPSTAAMNGSIFVFGGWSTQCGPSGCVTEPRVDVLAFVPSSSGVAPAVAQLPGPLAASSAVRDGARVYVSGGVNGATVSSAVLLFSPDSREFVSVSGVLPSPRFEHGSVLLSSGILVMGGREDSGRTVDTVFLVLSPPAVSLPNARGQPGQAVTIVAFINSTLGGVWDLDFGDGTSSQGTYPRGGSIVSIAHVYGAEGTYDIRLTAATGPDWQTNASATVLIRGDLLLSFTGPYSILLIGPILSAVGILVTIIVWRDVRRRSPPQ